MHRIFTLVCVCAVAVSGCATISTQMVPVAAEDVRVEEAAQREFVLGELVEAQRRLNAISYPMLISAVPLCGDKVSPRIGIQMSSLSTYTGEWIPAARSALGLSDTLSILSVTSGSAAERAGLRSGDRIIAIDGQSDYVGKGSQERASELLADAGSATRLITIARGGELRDVRIVPDMMCSFGTIVTIEGDINAFADGENVILPWAMMRFADDNELRVVVAHEIAHNAMGHIDAKRRNALLGGLFGALADVAMATQGVNTGGQHTADFMGLGAMTFSQDFEREADYVGLYLMARADLPLESAPDFWRQFAQINPRAISYASSHPTTAERFVRLRQTVAEIQGKIAEGRELLPEMKSTHKR